MHLAGNGDRLAARGAVVAGEGSAITPDVRALAACCNERSEAHLAIVALDGIVKEFGSGSGACCRRGEQSGGEQQLAKHGKTLLRNCPARETGCPTGWFLR